MNTLRTNWKKILAIILFWNAIYSASMIRFLDIGDCREWNYSLVLVQSLTLILLSLGLLVIVILSFVAVFSKRRRDFIIALSVSYIALTLTSFCLHSLTSSVQELALVRAVNNGGPLKEAIRAYWRQNKALPDSLEMLVPIFISNIPSTQMCSFPAFEYKNQRDNFELSVRSGMFYGEGFMYDSNGKYPPNHRMVNDWGYFNFD